MKAQPVIVNFIPDDGVLEIWIGNNCLTIEDFLTGTHTENKNE